MPNSPTVRFNVVNNNVEQSIPQLGVSHILARTTKGNPFDPSMVISSLAQFQREFGKEIVPDGSVSNIESALKGGSKLRIARVLGPNATRGTYKVASDLNGSLLVADTLLNNPLSESTFGIKVGTGKYLFFKLTSKGYGDVQEGLSNTFGVKLRLLTVNGLSTLYMYTYSGLDTASMTTPVSTTIVAKFNATMFDISVFKDFVENNGVVEVSLLGAKTTANLAGTNLEGITSLEDCYSYFDTDWLNGAIYMTTKASVTLPEVGDTWGGGTVASIDATNIIVVLTSSLIESYTYANAVGSLSYFNGSAAGNGYSDWHLPTKEQGLATVGFMVPLLFDEWGGEALYSTWFWTNEQVGADPSSHYSVRYDPNNLSAPNYTDESEDPNTQENHAYLVRSVLVSSLSADSKEMAHEDQYYVIGNEGSIGTTPGLEDWKKAFDAMMDYTDAYQLGASHVDQHLPSNVLPALHLYIGTQAEALKEFVYYIDVPLYNTTGESKDYEDIINWVNTMVNAIGNSAYVAYFAGGYKYMNSRGYQVDAQNLGTVLALGDASASTFGPWYHFSGAKRGLVINSKGVVSPNYGSHSNYAKLNALANARVNMAVVKDTVSMGKQVMLFHNFTSGLKSDSFRFLGVVRLVLYMKKQFRPILEAALEEPNLPVTWRGVNRNIMGIVNNLVSKQAITDPVYVGDQDATSLSQLQYNTEAEVRQGKYKAKLTFKDVVALQEITMDLEISTSDKQVTIN